MDETTRRLSKAMVAKEPGGMGKMGELIDNSILQYKLNKALEDADYWRLAYDKLLKHINSQSDYIRHLETQVYGGSTK